MWRLRKNEMKKIYSVILIVFISFQINAQTWTALTSGTSTSLVAVAVPSIDTAYVAGASGIILKTINGGITWTSQTSGTGNTLYQIAFIDNLKGFAVGDMGTVLQTTNGGTTWTNLSISAVSGIHLCNVYFYNSMQGYIVGAGGLIIKTTDGGTTWTSLTSGTSQQINGIAFTSTSVGYFSAFGGEVWKTIDGGTTWTSLTSGTTNPLGQIRFTSATDGFICGDLGTIIKTNNAGVTWTTIPSGTTTDNLTGMAFIDPTHGFVMGGNSGSNIGSRIETTNSGTTWTYSLPGTAFIERIAFFSPNLGYAAGFSGTILKYTNTIGIEENHMENNMTIYPNPFDAQSTISFDKEQKNVTVKIIDILGKEVRSMNFSGKELLIEKGNLQAGSYFVQIIDEKKNVSSKTIIIK
jgi:photosystem II stability/assembly factor-like uncharacterized protein